jgi:hypothetical protein
VLLQVLQVPRRQRRFLQLLPLLCRRGGGGRRRRRQQTQQKKKKHRLVGFVLDAEENDKDRRILFSTKDEEGRRTLAVARVCDERSLLLLLSLSLSRETNIYLYIYIYRYDVQPKPTGCLILGKCVLLYVECGKVVESTGSYLFWVAVVAAAGLTDGY